MGADEWGGLLQGNRENIDSMAAGSSKILTQVLKLVDSHDLYGSVAYPKKHSQMDISDIYRLPYATRGIFTNVALQEPFGLTVIEVRIGIAIACIDLNRGLSYMRSHPSNPQHCCQELQLAVKSSSFVQCYRMNCLFAVCKSPPVLCINESTLFPCPPCMTNQLAQTTSVAQGWSGGEPPCLWMQGNAHLQEKKKGHWSSLL